MKAAIQRCVQCCSRAKPVVVLMLILALGAGAYIAADQNQSSTDTSATDAISRMTDLTRAGRYEDAVKVGLESLKQASSDELVYEQIADVYLIRAEKEPTRREEWVIKAVSYLQKSLSHRSKENDVAAVHLFQDAKGFELAGDLSKDKRCTYYDEARKLLEERASALQGDKIRVAGKTSAVGPLRTENERALAGMQEKAARAQCE
jgi:hypothetical protein